MKINLLPPEMLPSRPSPVPYMPLGGLIAISVVWLIVQLATATGARGVTGTYRQEFLRASKELAPTKDIPDKLKAVEAQDEALKLKALAVTALTQNKCSFAPVFHAVAGTTPKSIRLTGISLDLANATATLTGYGSENTADVEAATLVRMLNADSVIARIFETISLDSCQSSKRGTRPVKEFSVSLSFRDRFKKATKTE